MEVNGYLWAAQAAASASLTFGMLAGGLFVASGLAAMTADFDNRNFGPAKKMLAAAAACAAISGAFGMVPSRSTILWSAALEHGPEYAERLISAIEKSN